MDLPEGGKPYEWVKTQILALADNVANERQKFGDRMEFINGVRWLLNHMDRHELLGVIAECLDGTALTRRERSRERLLTAKDALDRLEKDL